jgi:hypothetical protein
MRIFKCSDRPPPTWRFHRYASPLRIILLPRTGVQQKSQDLCKLHMLIKNALGCIQITGGQPSIRFSKKRARISAVDRQAAPGGTVRQSQIVNLRHFTPDPSPSRRSKKKVTHLLQGRIFRTLNQVRERKCSAQVAFLQQSIGLPRGAPPSALKVCCIFASSQVKTHPGWEAKRRCPPMRALSRRSGNLDTIKIYYYFWAVSQRSIKTDVNLKLQACPLLKWVYRLGVITNKRQGPFRASHKSGPRQRLLIHKKQMHDR